MNAHLSQHLVQIFENNRALVQPHYTIEMFVAAGKVTPGFHQWADGKPTHGGFLTRSVKGSAYWLLFIDWKEDDDYYLILLDENHNRPLAEIHSVSVTQAGEELCWKYRPARRDKKNEQRKEYFSKFFYDTDVIISLPRYPSELIDFLDELYSLAEIRTKADRLDPDLPDYRDGFPEGKRSERLHYVRERNSRIIKIVKEKFRQEHGSLFCQVCEFDFEEKYGQRGKGFIEAHHTVPVSELSSKGEETRIEDIALVCSNCHRMLHRYRPWLSMDELKKLLV